MQMLTIRILLREDGAVLYQMLDEGRTARCFLLQELLVFVGLRTDQVFQAVRASMHIVAL